jgi:hypothetical protein
MQYQWTGNRKKMPIGDKIIAGTWSYCFKIPDQYTYTLYTCDLEATLAYRKLMMWRSETVPRNTSSFIQTQYYVFAFLDATYLALETLITHSLPLTLLTQATGLSLLYFIEVLEYRFGRKSDN